MKVVLFRSYPREDSYSDDYKALSQYLVGVVSALPGFISVEQFKAADGESLTLVKFDSDEALTQWREHAQHREAQGRRGEFYARYAIDVCTLDRAYGWQAE